jgi:hypothetical protein
MQEIPKSTCAIDLTPTCMCTNDALNAAVGACSMQTCTTYELLRKNIPRYHTSINRNAYLQQKPRMLPAPAAVSLSVRMATSLS